MNDYHYCRLTEKSKNKQNFKKNSQKNYIDVEAELCTLAIEQNHLKKFKKMKNVKENISNQRLE